MVVWSWGEAGGKWSKAEIAASPTDTAATIYALATHQYFIGLRGKVFQDLPVAQGRVIVALNDHGIVALTVVGAATELQAEEMAKEAKVWPE